MVIFTKIISYRQAYAPVHKAAEKRHSNFITAVISVLFPQYPRYVHTNLFIQAICIVMDSFTLFMPSRICLW